MNIWSYNSLDFGSASVPFCTDGISTAGVLPGQIPWDRTLGFTNLADLTTRFDEAFPARSGGPRTAPPITLGILAHGRPDGIAVLPDRRVLDSTGYGATGSTLVELNRILHRGTRPTMILYACAAGARHRSTPASTDSLLVWMSLNMENTQIVGFTRLLTLDGLRTVDQPEGRFCLAPDVYELNEEYDYGRDIRAQGLTDTTGGALPLAGLESVSAIHYLNGRIVSTSAPRDSGTRDRRRRRAGPVRPD